MASTKKFANLKKPVRQPTPEQIAAFEETGRAAPSVKTETQKSANEEIRNTADTEVRIHDDEETLISANADLRQDGNPPTQFPAKAGSQKSANTETRFSGPIVRLTIDLPESVHTRFKGACALSKRKMVDEVREFVELRTAELEREAGR